MAIGASRLAASSALIRDHTPPSGICMSSVNCQYHTCGRPDAPEVDKGDHIERGANSKREIRQRFAPTHGERDADIILFHSRCDDIGTTCPRTELYICPSSLRTPPLCKNRVYASMFGESLCRLKASWEVHTS